MNRTRKHEILDDVEAALGVRKIFLTIPEIAQITSLHQQTVRKMLERGELKSNQNGKHCRYRVHYTELEYFYKEAA